MTVRSVRSTGLHTKKISEIPAKIDCLVYGPPKLGKTTFALTAQDVPEMGKYLHIAAERGEETIRDTYPDTEVMFLDTDDDERWLERYVDQWDRFDYIYQELRAGGHGFGTVCIDTMDVLQTINIGAIMETADSVIAGTQDRDIPSKREYGKSRTEMKRYIRQFQNLPMNVIWVCHSTTEQNERTKRWERKPMLVGKLQDEVGGMVNNLLYFSMTPAIGDGVAQRVLVTAADGEIQAGTRSRVLNDMGEILDPVMSKVWYPLTAGPQAA
jgi:hypothetical protein